ncbi:adenosylcobinamide-GDP ribazoletransferase [Trichothermofontia sp.]
MLRFIAAIAFYTRLPVPSTWPLDFQGIARLAPLVGLLIGSLLGVGDYLLSLVGIPNLTRSAVLVVGGLALTGGLHLDGAIDAADGLAVPDPDRRLAVMRDSVTGAFGVMAAVAIVLLKVAALADLTQHRWLALLLIPAWGRWGQLLAIVRYPYLRPTGKGALHKAAIQSPWEPLPTALLLILLSGLGSLAIFELNPLDLSTPPPDRLSSVILTGLALSAAGLIPAIATGAWFHRQLGGHTGDTYGAVVEWSETFSLVLVTLILGKTVV